MRPDVAAWLARACADAEARGLEALVPLLQGLARSTAALRDADDRWATTDGRVPMAEVRGARRDDGHNAD